MFSMLVQHVSLQTFVRLVSVKHKAKLSLVSFFVHELQIWKSQSGDHQHYYHSSWGGPRCLNHKCYIHGGTERKKPSKPHHHQSHWESFSSSMDVCANIWRFESQMAKKKKKINCRDLSDLSTGTLNVYKELKYKPFNSVSDISVRAKVVEWLTGGCCPPSSRSAHMAKNEHNSCH